MRRVNAFSYSAFLVTIAISGLGWFFWAKAPHWIKQQTDEEFSALQAATVMTTARVLRVDEHLIGGLPSNEARAYCPIVSFVDCQGVSHRTQAPCAPGKRSAPGALLEVRYQPTTAEVVWTAQSESVYRFGGSMASLISKVMGASCFVGAVGMLKAAQSNQ